jgi:membrane-associated phospholipid phosphatase
LTFTTTGITRTGSSAVLVFALCLHLAGCGTVGGGVRWGENATTRPGWSRVGQSAYHALTSPLFYVPASVALLLRVGNADQRLSDWAVEHTPVYGSPSRADRAGKSLGAAASGLWALSVLGTPGGNDLETLAGAKSYGALVQLAAVGVNGSLVYALKNGVDSERPDGGDEGFPSGTSANASAFAALASRNVHTMDLGDAGTLAADAGLYGLAYATAWGRVEAGRHYPTDALAGVAQGYFISAFVNDAFLVADPDARSGPVAWFDGERYVLTYCWRF